MKSRKITALVAAASLLVSTWAIAPVSAATLKTENFANLDNITKNDTIDPVLGEISHTNDGSGSLSTSVNHMGSKYVNEAANQTVEVWFYDSMESTATGLIKAADTFVGLNGAVNKTNYLTRTTNNWQVSSIARSKGWHQIVMDGTNPTEGVKAYLDGVLVIPGKSPASTTQIADLEFVNSWGGNGECYFDDIKITDEPVVVDTENNGDATELKAAVAAAWDFDLSIYVKDENYDAYVASRLAANNVAVSINKTQTQIDDAMTALDDAKGALTLAQHGIKTFSIGGNAATIEGETITVTMSNLANMVDFELFGGKGSLTINEEPLNIGDAIADLSQPVDIIFTPEEGDPITYQLTATVKDAKLPVPANAALKYEDDMSTLTEGAVNGQGTWTSAGDGTVMVDKFGKKGNTVFHSTKDKETRFTISEENQVKAPFIAKMNFYDNGVEPHNMTYRFYYSNGKMDFLANNIGNSSQKAYQLRLESSGTRQECGTTVAGKIDTVRTAGWHEFAVMADEEGNMSYYVDGVRIKFTDGRDIANKIATDVTVTGAGVSCAGWNGKSNDCYLSGFEFYQLVPKIQIPGIIEKPEEGTLTEAIKAAAAEAGVSGEMTVNYGALGIDGVTIDADGVANLPEGVYGQYSGTVAFTISVDGSEVAKGTAKVSATGGDAVAAGSAVFDGWTQEEGGASTTEAKTATFDFYAKAGTGIGIGTKIGITFGRVQVIVKDSTGAVVATDKIDLFFPLQAVSKAIVVSNTVDNGDGTITVTPFAAEADGKYTVEIKAEGVGYTDISNKVFVTGVTLNQ